MHVRHAILPATLLALAGPGVAGLPDPVTRCAIGRFRDCDIRHAIERGLVETGLVPRFPDQARCRGIDEGFAISYSHKRDREQYHGGIDIPAPSGTPIIAAADGTVVAKYQGLASFRGIELVVRHAPEDTGLPAWVYTQYAHFSELPAVQVGERVRRGQRLGPTGNTGIGRTGRQSQRRRPAIHFGAFYSDRADYVDAQERIIPLEGHWMDPLALWRGKPPLDSASLQALPAADKEVNVAVVLEDGSVLPQGARIVWPYACARG